MAVSTQASSTVVSLVQAVPKISSTRRSGDGLLRSQFLGSGPVHSPHGTGLTQVVRVRNVAKAGGIRSESFFEKLAKLFSNEVDKEQLLPVYEINKRDRKSPVLLKGGSKDVTPTLGDLVPYTNKVYDASTKRYLGLSAGFCVCIENTDGTPAGAHYETTYTHYFDGYGQLSAMGPYYVSSDTEMVVTGGTGIFKGAQGVVTLKSVNGPFQILYTYHLKGIPTLPSELIVPVDLTPVPVPAPSLAAPPVPVAARA